MSQADEIADGFLSAHRDFYEMVDGATPEQWRATGINHPEIRVGDEDEGRPVATIVHHVGTAYLRARGRCQAWIRGEDPELPGSGANARHHAENPSPDKAETLAFLDREAKETATFIRGLTDEDLAAGGRFVTGPTTVGDFLGRTVPFHIRWHQGSIRATWEQLAERT